MECFNCGKELGLELGAHVSRSETCDHCHADIRSCRMCEFYDTTAYNECREPSADRIVEKEKANFCDYYKLTDKKGDGEEKVDPFAAANALFKD